jgi:methanogenic corrinoid protein MtbC1
MTKIKPAAKQLMDQRDKEIFEYIQVFLEKGYQSSQIYEKLHLLTGLMPNTIMQIRFNLQKKLINKK